MKNGDPLAAAALLERKDSEQVEGKNKMFEGVASDINP